MQAPPEQLGSFYLGAEYDIQTGKRNDERPVSYDARDLTTHAICVGMTGSGKTGLCIGMLEEAAMDRVPAILIDPKGDITNLLLQFPELTPAAFQPWINEDDARRKDKTVEEFATSTAEQWKTGLADWGITGERIRALQATTEYTIFTPGSDMGVPINILGSLAAPQLDWATESEAIRERISGTVAALMGLAGISADPVRSREGILLSTIFEFFWQKNEDLDLAKLILSIQTPPVQQLGVFTVDTFFPEKDRFNLAMAFNTLVASPRFQVWLQGEPLDIDRLYFNAEGKPRHSIIYIAHLSESERMFIVTLLLENLITWMRRQSGTTSLRALLYFDEVFGYFPPTAEPSSKRPLLTLLKQARAFGLGCVLVTQNPVDIDYKGLTNAGTWFIGKLQAERDKERVLTGLKGALSEAGKESKADYDTLITKLGSRVFLMHNVHDEGPVVFTTRWAQSYLRGPLTLPQVRSLMAERKRSALVTPTPVAATAPVAAPVSPPAGAMPPSLPPAPAAATLPAAVEAASPAPVQPAVPAGFSAMLPAIDPAVTQVFLPLVTNDSAALRAVTREAGGQVTAQRCQLVYEAGIASLATVRYADQRMGITAEQNLFLLTPGDDSIGGIDWKTAEAINLTSRDLARRPEETGNPDEGPFFAPVPSGASNAKKLAAAAKDLNDHLYYNSRMEVNYHPLLKLAQKPGEDDRSFNIRLQQASRELRDKEVDKLTKTMDTQLKRIVERIEKAKVSLAKKQATQQQKTLETFMNAGGKLLTFFGGRRSMSTIGSALSTTTSKFNQANDAAMDAKQLEELIVELTAEANQLEVELKEKSDEILQRWEQTLQELTKEELKPKRTDVDISLTALAWLPMWRISYDDGLRVRTATIAAYQLPPEA